MALQHFQGAWSVSGPVCPAQRGPDGDRHLLLPVEEQALLGREVVVDGLLRYAAALGDFGHLHLVEAPLEEHSVAVSEMSWRIWRFLRSRKPSSGMAGSIVTRPSLTSTMIALVAEKFCCRILIATVS